MCDATPNTETTAAASIDVVKQAVQPSDDTHIDASTRATECTTSPNSSSASSTKPILSDAATRRKLAILDKIRDYEVRGAILDADAHTLRNQVHSSTSGQWHAVETRLKQLAMSWNPYQDINATADRHHASSSSPLRRQRPPLGTAPSSAPPAAQPVAQHKQQDLYDLLQLDDRELATSDDVKRQFRKLALQVHPDKQQQAAAATTGDNEPPVAPTHAFARLRLAYETLSDPLRRAAYDASLQATTTGASTVIDDAVVVGSHQIQLEATTDFASLEWLKRVKHKMDVMDRLATWATILELPPTDVRFETGDVCTGRSCGKIVSMDRDLAHCGSQRRRVYVCLRHRYVHACDDSCTSRPSDGVRDARVCRMRAFWLVQNWLFDQLTAQTNDRDDRDKSMELEASAIQLGDAVAPFCITNAASCTRDNCATAFQYLEDGIFACRRHGTPHVCTFEQCDAKVLQAGRYVCWCTHARYGGYREEAGTETRTRQLVYTNAHGDATAIAMDVPVLLPLGALTSYLLGDGDDRRNNENDDVSSLSPPPPSAKLRHVDPHDDRANDCGSPVRGRRIERRRSLERETSPVRARIRRRLEEKVRQADVASFTVHIKLPPAVATLPRVALELQDPRPAALSVDSDVASEPLLPVRVRANDTINYIKVWLEELTDQQLSIWDQQLLWGDTVLGDESTVMVLDEHGIVDGCVLELRLHDDCPLLVSTWSSRTAASGGGGDSSAEYNTVLISKEAEEDLEEQFDEWTATVAVEEAAFARSRMKRKREKLEDTGALQHMEVLEYDGDAPRLVGVVPLTQRSAAIVAGDDEEARLVQPGDDALATTLSRPPAIVPAVGRTRDDDDATQDAALRAIAHDAQPLKKRPKQHK